MIEHIKIYDSLHNYVHFDKKANSYTLCGLETDGDEYLRLKRGVTVKQKVNCPDCIDIVEFCLAIKPSEYK